MKTTDSEYDDIKVGWYPMRDAYARMGAYQSPEAKEFCDALLKRATATRPHLEPQHRKDKRFTLYWLLRSAIEGSSTKNEKGEGWQRLRG